MKRVLILWISIFLSVSAYAQYAPFSKSSGGKRNTVSAIRHGKVDRHTPPTEGDGTGDMIVGQRSKRIKHKYNDFIRQRQKFAERRYKLKTGGGEPIKPTR
jgi:hypothetical protein